jgi:hypothetical protein
MRIEQWASEHLIDEVPVDMPVWHWTGTQPAILMNRISHGDLSDFSEGVTGKGFYVSTSAIDLIDKGNDVLYAVVPAGTRVLVVDPDLFGVGVVELFDMLLEQHGFRWKSGAWRGQVDRESARPAKEVVPRLLDMLGLSACLYIFGFHLAFMARTSACLRRNPTVDAARTVADYVAAHPEARPTLASMEVVKRYLAKRGLKPGRE